MKPLDARTDEVGPELVAPVCILGTGAAGITLARALGAAGVEVLLVESGGLALDGPTQALYAGRNIGLPYYDLLTCRLRFFGGTTNHWAGFCRANNPVNYEARPDLGLPAWPVGFDEIAPYLAQAAESLGISPDFFEPFRLMREAGVEADDIIDRSQDRIFTAVNQISRRRKLGEIYLDELTAMPNVRIVTHLNVADIRLSDDARKVAQVACRTLTGKEVTLRASAFVLCAHAIENARLLLASNSVARDGIGNGRGLVGRYFMEHPQIEASLLAPTAAFPAFYDRGLLESRHFAASLSLAPETLRREGVLSYHIGVYGAFASSGARRAARRFARDLLEPFSPSMLDDARTILAETGGLALSAIEESGLVSLPQSMKMMSITHTIEQAPNPDSRVLLSPDRRDALGMPEADLDWQLSETDLRTLQVGQRTMVAELSALGMGRFSVDELDWGLVRERVRGHFHHYGTTRMSASPSDGVVDARQKVHGVENLYVGGSSVFPTSGAHGPTMHIIGFTLRLADTLRERLPAMERPG
jgi:choline dehydrogenase-like flavoprotein